MRIGIASHVVSDTLNSVEGGATRSIGGPPCYAGLICRKFGFEVVLATRVGQDIADEIRRTLSEEKIILDENHISTEPTTRFTITSEKDTRTMVLQSKCAPVAAKDIELMDVDCWLVSPVYDEISAEVLRAIKSNSGSRDFVMLDPQGYMRSADADGRISLRQRVELDMQGIRAIKVDPQEMNALTGGLVGVEGMRALQSYGIGLVLSTLPGEVHLLHKDIHYWTKLEQVPSPDSTGTGDILAGAFCCAYIKEKDPLWALCFAAGAIKAALESRQIGLKKIPAFSRIEENASYFYNTVGFRQLS